MKPRPASYDSLPWVLTPEEVAPLLNVGLNTVYELLRSNQIKHIRIGVQYRILKQNLLLFFEEEIPEDKSTISQNGGEEHGTPVPESLQERSSLYWPNPRIGRRLDRRIRGNTPGL